ncbi:hypothetical protein M153_15310002, partial [Pseudoloma neurophilia]
LITFINFSFLLFLIMAILNPSQILFSFFHEEENDLFEGVHQLYLCVCL